MINRFAADQILETNTQKYRLHGEQLNISLWTFSMNGIGQKENTTKITVKINYPKRLQ